MGTRGRVSVTVPLVRTCADLVQVGSCLALIALITGFFRARLFFLIAAITSGLSALLLMM